MKPTYAQALKWALEKCHHARDTNCPYIEARVQPSCETGFLLLRRHKDPHGICIPNPGTLEEWAEAIVKKVLKEGWCQAPEPVHEHDHPEAGLKEYTY